MALLLGSAGCYSYVPIQNPAPRMEVRAIVPVTSAVTLPGRSQGSFNVEGFVVSTGDTLVLETETTREYGAFREVSRLDTLRVATSSLIGLEERVFSKPKSGVLAALVVGGVVGLASGLFSIRNGDGGGGDGNGGNPAAQRISRPWTLNLGPIFGH